MTQTIQPAAAGTTRRVPTEPNQRRVRVFFGGEAVADSSRTIYLFETGHLPVYYFPREIENLLAFYNEKTDITVNGIPQERPVTKWS